MKLKLFVLILILLFCSGSSQKRFTFRIRTKSRSYIGVTIQARDQYEAIYKLNKRYKDYQIMRMK